MAPILLLAPAFLLALGAGLGPGLTALRVRTGRVPAAGGAWLATLLLIAIWVSNRGPQELSGPNLGTGVSLSLRLDALSFGFGLFLLVPAALLLSLQPREPAEAALAALATASGLLVVLAGGFSLAALVLGAPIILLMVQLRIEHQRGAGAFWPWQVAAWIGILGAAAALQAGGGTSLYAALPARAMSGPIFGVVAVAGVAMAGLMPWRSWPGQLWKRPRLQATGLIGALTFPIGLYFIVRSVDVAEGRLPGAWAGPVLIVAGLLTTVAASIRAQSATTRRSFLGEMVAATGGFALLALGTGTQLGVAGAVATAAAAALAAGLLPLVPEDGGAAALLGLGVVAGLPPGLAFGARLLDVAAAVESNEPAAVAGLVAAAAWTLSLAGAGRAAWLPGLGRGGPGLGGGPAVFVALLSLIAGAGLGLLMTGVVVPAAEEITRPLAGTVSSTAMGVTTASGSWASLPLGGPLLVLALGLGLASRPLWARLPPPRAEAPPPLFAVPGGQALAAALAGLGAARIPDQYRSLFDLRAVERKLGEGRPALWLAVLAALVVAVTR